MNIYKNVTYLNQADYSTYIKYITFSREKYPFFAYIPKILKKAIFGSTCEVHSRPLMLKCETINICTNDCIFCPYGKMTREKKIMSLEMFEKVLSDYSDIGGGYITLTPNCGEIFLDNLLEERLSILENYKDISVSFTTNSVPADRFSDSELKWILDHLKKVHISVYGLDPEEYELITRRGSYSKMVSNVKRIAENIDRDNTWLQLHFRFLKNHQEKDVKDWIQNSFGMDIPYSYMYTYMNWNGAINDKDPLPFSGKWREKITINSHCNLPLALGIVYSNGDVSYCPCNDFDISAEFKLGNIADKSLDEIFNSKKNIELWKNVPKKCINCNSYRPMENIFQKIENFQNPLSYIGA